MASIKETKDVIDFALAVVKVVASVKADGKVDLNDLSALLPLIAVSGPAMENIGAVPAELKDLDGAEAAELISHVMAGLTIDDAKAKQVLEAALKTVASVYALYQAIKEPAVGPSGPVA